MACQLWTGSSGGKESLEGQFWEELWTIAEFQRNRISSSKGTQRYKSHSWKKPVLILFCFDL